MPINASRLKSIGPWLAEKGHAWLCVEVICIALLICITLIRSFGPNTAELFIRYTGLCLQIAGLYTVIWGISKTRALFGRPSFVSEAKEWLSRFPLLRHDTVMTMGSGKFIISSPKVRMYGRQETGANPTIEERLDALEKNVTSIHERIIQAQKEMDEEFQKITDSLKREEQTRQIEDSAIREKLEVTGTGGLHISAIGASWLFAGIILSTTATEIAALFK